MKEEARTITGCFVQDITVGILLELERKGNMNVALFEYALFNPAVCLV